MSNPTEPARRRYSVEVETEDMGDIAMPLPVFADHITRALGDVDDAIEVAVGVNGTDRSVYVQATVAADDAGAALRLIARSVEAASRHGGHPVVPLRRLSSAPEANPEAHRIDHTAWPPQFSATQRLPQQAALETARLFAAAHATARQLRTSGGGDAAAALERWLRPGLSTLEALHGLRNELIGLCGTHSPMAAGLDTQLGQLLIAANHNLAALRSRGGAGEGRR